MRDFRLRNDLTRILAWNNNTNGLNLPICFTHGREADSQLKIGGLGPWGGTGRTKTDGCEIMSNHSDGIEITQISCIGGL